MDETTLVPQIIEGEIDLLPGFYREDVVDLKRSIDPTNKLTWSQLKVFLNLCANLKLDPRKKQIYPIPRWDKKTQRLQLTTVVSIDGLRLVAERTGKYAPGKPTEYIRNDKGYLLGATVFVKKMTSDGTWHEVSETAFLCEYNSTSNSFWQKMPHVMIAKVAEARALRRAFPDTFSGVFGEEEMDQASSNNSPTPEIKEPAISDDEWKALDSYLINREDLREKLKKLCNVENLRTITKPQLEACKRYAIQYNKAQACEKNCA